MGENISGIYGSEDVSEKTHLQISYKAIELLKIHEKEHTSEYKLKTGILWKSWKVCFLRTDFNTMNYVLQEQIELKQGLREDLILEQKH